MASKITMKHFETKKMYAITEDEVQALEAMLSWYKCHKKDDYFINYILEPFVDNMRNVYVGNGTKELPEYYTEEIEKLTY